MSFPPREGGQLPCMKTPAALSDDLVEIYLNDHLAGATAGRELAHRTARANSGSDFGPPLAAIAAEIDEDHRELVALIRRLGRRRDPLKLAAGRLAERAGRLKLNGRLRGYSPLSRLLEVEGLAIGVEGKRRLWVALHAVADRHAGLEAPELDRLIERAGDQHRRLTELHERAAALALAP